MTVRERSKVLAKGLEGKPRMRFRVWKQGLQESRKKQVKS